MGNNYYVYIFTDPRTSEPFYVGKGKGNRYKNHEKELNPSLEYHSGRSKYPERLLSLKLRVFYDLQKLELKPEIELIENLSESDAFIIELTGKIEQKLN